MIQTGSSANVNEPEEANCTGLVSGEAVYEATTGYIYISSVIVPDTDHTQISVISGHHVGLMSHWNNVGSLRFSLLRLGLYRSLCD